MSETKTHQLPDVAERFMRYVQVDSQSNPENDTVTPSTPAPISYTHLTLPTKA